jgi:hypothetical protein
MRAQVIDSCTAALPYHLYPCPAVVVYVSVDGTAQHIIQHIRLNGRDG